MTTPDQQALEKPGFWFRKVYYVDGKPLFTVDDNDIPIPLEDSHEERTSPLDPQQGG